MDSDIIQGTEIQRLPLTQDENKSKIQYSWVILFDIDIHKPNPFFIVKLRDFVDTDFPWKSMKDVMTPETRIASHTCSNFPGSKFHIFAKVEYGN